MLTAYTCSDTFSNRFNSTSDGSHSSLHATFRLTFRTYTLSRITVQAYACTSGHPPARSSPPLLGGRTIGRADRPCQHHDVCNHRCHRIPTVRKLPARSRHRSPTLSQTVRGSRLTPAAASRWSNDRPRRPPVPTCVQPSVSPDTQGTQAACAVAPSLPDTLADCAWQPAHSRHLVLMVENRSRRPFAALSSVVTDSGAASARGSAFFMLGDPFCTRHRRLHQMPPHLGSALLTTRGRAQPFTSMPCGRRPRNSRVRHRRSQ